MTYRDPMDGSDDDAPVYCDHGVDITRDDCWCNQPVEEGPDTTGYSASPSPAVDETVAPDEDPFF